MSTDPQVAPAGPGWLALWLAGAVVLTGGVLLLAAALAGFGLALACGSGAQGECSAAVVVAVLPLVAAGVSGSLWVAAALRRTQRRAWAYLAGSLVAPGFALVAHLLTSAPG